jgi:methyltransferase (TIGR00027 family)
MSETSPSRTALGVAILRAAHQQVDTPPLILDDPVALALLDEPSRAWVTARPPELHAPGARALRAHVVVRSRFAEDRLAAAVGRGVRQYVILGAGYDTFAYRQPPWAQALRVLEVDLAATQAAKRARLDDARIAVPPNVSFVSMDFGREDLGERLAASGFDRTSPALFAWLGVSMYLDETANEEMFRFVAAQPRGAELVFTFAPRAAPEDAARGRGLAEMAARVGEPWKTFYDPAVLASRLCEIGFATVWLPTPADLTEAYFRGRSDDLPAPRRRTMASAIV